MSKSHEVEYCNLDLKFDRKLIRHFVKSLIQAGFSLYWSENEKQFTISIRSGRKLIKLKFERSNENYIMIGTYSFKDEKLAQIIEKLIEDTRGHAVVKRFKDQQITIENIVYGEMIRIVEISGIDHKVIYQRDNNVTSEEIIQAIMNKRAEERIEKLREEIDMYLLYYQQALKLEDQTNSLAYKKILSELSREMISLEM